MLKLIQPLLSKCLTLQLRLPAGHDRATAFLDQIRHAQQTKREVVPDRGIDPQHPRSDSQHRSIRDIQAYGCARRGRKARVHGRVVDHS
jgi:hypothetical protein